MNTTKSIATAIYRDTYQGDLIAYLTPQRTKRQGVAVTVFMWMTERGAGCGFAHGCAAAGMVSRALRHPSFSDVSMAIAAREQFAI
jgi:hypothetical protein